MSKMGGKYSFLLFDRFFEHQVEVEMMNKFVKF